MKMYVVRHGQSEANRDWAHAGWGLTPLTEKGQQQARAAGELLKDIAFEKVYVSDVRRTRQTASLVLPGYQYCFDGRIREIHVGSLVGKRVEDCKASMGEPYRKALAIQDYVAYGGENMDMVQERVNRFMKDMEREAAAGLERIAVVSHEGPIRCMVKYVLQCDFHKSHVRIGNCSVTLLECKNGNWKLWVSGMEKGADVL